MIVDINIGLYRKDEFNVRPQQLANTLSAIGMLSWKSITITDLVFVKNHTGREPFVAFRVDTPDTKTLRLALTHIATSLEQDSVAVGMPHKLTGTLIGPNTKKDKFDELKFYWL